MLFRRFGGWLLTPLSASTIRTVSTYATYVLLDTFNLLRSYLFLFILLYKFQLKNK